MTQQEIQSIVAQVVTRCLQKQEGPQQMCAVWNEIPAEASARHVHLTRESVEALFGKGAALTKRRDLSQKGEFLSEQRIRVVTPKGELSNVAVLGPERSAVQVELSRSDCRVLGIQAPVRLSGNLSGAADVYLIGPNGMVQADGSAIVAKAHIHLPPDEAVRRGLHDGQLVSVRMESSRPLTFEGIEIRVKDSFTPALHIDLDEANACALDSQTRAIILSGEREPLPIFPGKQTQEAKKEPVEIPKLVTEQVARRLIAQCQGSLTLSRKTILTPSAMDVFRQSGICIERE